MRQLRAFNVVISGPFWGDRL